MNNVNAKKNTELKMYRISGPLNKNLDKFLSKLEQEQRSDFMSIITCIDVTNAINISKELRIYSTKIKSDINNAFTIDELLFPLENIIKIYINFRKQVNDLTPDMIKKLNYISVSTKENIDVIKRIRKTVPSLLNDITKEEFIETIEKFREKSRINFIVNQNVRTSISKIERTLNCVCKENPENIKGYNVKKMRELTKDLKNIIETITQEDLNEFHDKLEELTSCMKLNYVVFFPYLNKKDLDRLSSSLNRTNNKIEKHIYNQSNTEELIKINNYQHYAMANYYHFAR